MSTSLKAGMLAVCLTMAASLFASPMGSGLAKKGAGKRHSHVRTIPARHNAGRPMRG